MNNGLQQSIISLWPVYSIQLQFLSAVKAAFGKVRENKEEIGAHRLMSLEYDGLKNVPRASLIT